MSNDDWFRRPCLTEQEQSAFEQRLRRARSARPEYMRIQAHALHTVGSYSAAIALINRVLTDHPDHLPAWVVEQRAEAHRCSGNAQDAIDDYLAALAAMEVDRGLVGNAPVRLASLAIETARRDLYETCLEYLTKFWDPDPLFPREELQQFGFTAVLLDRLGKSEDAKPPARRALAAALKTKSNAANHRQLGLASDKDRPLIELLQRIVEREGGHRRPRSLGTMLDALKTWAKRR